MQIDVYSHTGSKLKAMDLPGNLFDAPLNWGLMHQSLMLQQNNRRQSAAHVQTRGEVQGSTKKLFSQKHTGRARRGPVRSPVLRGGGKAFGPRNIINYVTRMPKNMRHAALRSCLAVQAQKGALIGLDNYPETVKTKAFVDLLKKLPIEHGRKVLIVTTGNGKSILLSSRNIPAVKTIQAGYLNPEDILNSRHVIFTTDAIAEAAKLFGKKEATSKIKPLKARPVKEEAPAGATKAVKAKKAPAKKKAASKKPSDSSAS